MKIKGFTLIELLAALAVAVILATVAVPSFQELMARNRLAADFNHVLSGLNYARSEAVKRRDDITVNISGAWQVQVTHIVGGVVTTMKTLSSDDGSVAISAATPDPFSITFNELGRANCPVGTPCSVTLQYQGGDSETLQVNAAGMVSRP
ncbi:GspH/FimT family pseudopilin [Halomonas sp. M4R1S46]|uniref:GspH/FimT family pseudopilin n=1 Tax=Halomonas sp. M4R1S46 TaxID=2982692 RepID=UPI0021E43208|nr:GspH/FimT family pseudopilin [Halomonas sp. M4R1S46]UYG08080.1 GspH/FimT family pseudopilin [Halomonas sp. M4R1S46]